MTEMLKLFAFAQQKKYSSQFIQFLIKMQIFYVLPL